MTTFANQLIAPPCHLGIGDLPFCRLQLIMWNKFIDANSINGRQPCNEAIFLFQRDASIM
jgi:hypothetical protein